MTTSDPPRLAVTVAALIGVLATGAALAAGQFVAGLVEPGSAPFLAVGNSAIDLTPEPVKAWAIRQFGEQDKLVLLLGMAAVILLLSVLAGLVSRQRALPGLVLIGGFGGLGIAAAATRPDLGLLGLLAPIAALATGIATFDRLRRAALASRATPASGSRRRFLAGSAGVAAGAGVAWLAGDLLAGTRGAEASRRAIGAVTATSRAPAIPAGADFAALGTPPFLTSNADFYRVDTALSIPRLRAEDLRLRVHGLVDRELTLTYEDLRRRPLVEKTITMTCVSNEVGGPYLSTANFTGVPIHEILREAGVRPGAQQVFSTSKDGFTAGTPLDVLLEPRREALLAIGMNGEPLPLAHGFPVRMVTPGLYGYLSATKWLVDLELTTFARESYWEKRGWAEHAPIKTQSRIDRPRGFERFPAGRMTAAGIAWAQPRGIDRVEVRVDGGPWRPAALSTEVSPHTWRMWRIDLELAPGGHTIECRATDRAGQTQTPDRVPPVPDGATGWHSVFCTAL